MASLSLSVSIRIRMSSPNTSRRPTSMSALLSPFLTSSWCDGACATAMLAQQWRLLNICNAAAEVLDESVYNGRPEGERARTVLMRAGAHRDCRHLERAKISAYSLSLCMPCAIFDDATSLQATDA